MAVLEVDSILFDMDGTLVDESSSYREAIRLTAEYLLRRPVSMDEVREIKRYPGFNGDWDATWGLVGRRLHGSIFVPSDADRGSYAYRRLRDIFQTYYLGDRMWRQISGRPPDWMPPFRWDDPLFYRERPLVAAETLQQLTGFALGIVTSRPRVEALMALHQQGLDRYFTQDVLVAAEDTPRHKPDPAPLREMVRRLGARRPVYVGDSIDDALAALAAGMAFLHVGVEPFVEERAERAVHGRISSVQHVVALCRPTKSGEANRLPASPGR
ncbi:MAG TPA: HAD-IA family hydrolase [Chloroflexota bacterium]|nr:HAD-IA family hydrolase [Chloroflexota bacterium]